jgi:hypothetical protein
MDAQYIFPFGIDRKNRAAKWMADQIPEQRASDAADGLAGADYGDIAGRKMASSGWRL